MAETTTTAKYIPELVRGLERLARTEGTVVRAFVECPECIEAASPPEAQPVAPTPTTISISAEDASELRDAWMRGFRVGAMDGQHYPATAALRRIVAALTPVSSSQPVETGGMTDPAVPDQPEVIYDRGGQDAAMAIVAAIRSGTPHRVVELGPNDPCDHPFCQRADVCPQCRTIKAHVHCEICGNTRSWPAGSPHCIDWHSRPDAAPRGEVPAPTTEPDGPWVTLARAAGCSMLRGNADASGFVFSADECRNIASTVRSLREERDTVLRMVNGSGITLPTRNATGVVDRVRALLEGANVKVGQLAGCREDLDAANLLLASARNQRDDALTEVAALREQLEEAKAVVSCSVCGGQPLKSGRKCICKGIGTEQAEMQGLREYALIEAPRELEALRARLALLEEQALSRHQAIEQLPRPQFFYADEDFMRGEYATNHCKNMDDPIDELIVTQQFARAVLSITQPPVQKAEP